VALYATTVMNRPAPGSLPDPALVDFGARPGGPGRRLERLGGVLVDRPLPLPGLPAPLDRDWSAARAVFGGGVRGWSIDATCPTPWQVTIPLGTVTLVLEVRPAPSGQVGVFLEQAPRRRRARSAVRKVLSPEGASRRCCSRAPTPPKTSA